MTTRITRTTLAACLMGLTMSAASGPCPEGATVAQRHSPAARNATAGPDCEAVKKRGGPMESGVSLAYEVPDRVAVGQTVTLRFRFAGISASDGASLEIRESGSRRVLFSGHLAHGEERQVEITYTPQKDGRQYLDVTTRQSGRVSVRSVGLNVGSGKVTLKREGKSTVTRSGEPVISLPADKR